MPALEPLRPPRLVAALPILLANPDRASAGHVLLDHAPREFTPQDPPPAGLISGGDGAEWRLLETFATGNPLTDLDFFTQNGEMFMSAGTLGTGPNSGGQTILKLTEGGQVAPSFVASHPSASSFSDPIAALGLQHDVEATPKGDVLFNTKVPAADTSDAQHPGDLVALHVVGEIAGQHHVRHRRPTTGPSSRGGSCRNR